MAEAVRKKLDQNKALGDACFRERKFEGAVRHYESAVEHVEDGSLVSLKMVANGCQALLEINNLAKCWDWGVLALSVLEIREQTEATLSLRFKCCLRIDTAAQRAGKSSESGIGFDSRPYLLRAMAVAQKLPIERLAPLAAKVTEAAIAAGRRLPADASAPGAPLPRRKPPVTAVMIPKGLRSQWEYTPSPDGTDTNLLLVLHGLGDTPANITRFARGLELPQTAVLGVSGPYSVVFAEGSAFIREISPLGESIGPPRGVRPYAAKSEASMGRSCDVDKVRMKSLAHTVQLLAQLVATLREGCGWELSSIHGLGFGQGGTALLHAMAAPRAARNLLKLRQGEGVSVLGKGSTGAGGAAGGGGGEPDTKAKEGSALVKGRGAGSKIEIAEDTSFSSARSVLGAAAAKPQKEAELAASTALSILPRFLYNEAALRKVAAGGELASVVSLGAGLLEESCKQWQEYDKSGEGGVSADLVDADSLIVLGERQDDFSTEAAKCTSACLQKLAIRSNIPADRAGGTRVFRGRDGPIPKSKAEVRHLMEFWSKRMGRRLVELEKRSDFVFPGPGKRSMGLAT